MCLYHRYYNNILLKSKPTGRWYITDKNKMKKIALAVLFAFVSMFSINNAYANNGIDKTNHDAVASSQDCADSPSAYVYDVRYDDDGTIVVTVRIKNKERGRLYRIKVTPKDKIAGTIVEGARYGTIGDNVDCEVTFHCYSGKESEAPYCRQYDFNAEIVD